MGYYVAIPLLALAAALQSSIIPDFRLLSGQVDLVFLLVIAWGMRAPLEEGLFWAFVGGILQDLLSITPTGASSIGLVLLIFLIDYLRRQLFRVSLLLLIALVIGGTILQQGIIYTALLLTGNRYDVLEMLRSVLLPEIFLNLVLMLPVYLVVRLLQRRVAPPPLTA
ncbi:MAG: rod shape-determining protein MreD [Anaerolineae bacterium]|jgi:rod shape-determining protein MreD|nr:rod shape-determining protein MreD [Anaerolineae bacterium]